MTVKPLGNGRYTGLSTDTKPTAANTAVNAIFEETDTRKRYYNSGTDWVPQEFISYKKFNINKEGTTITITDINNRLLQGPGTDADDIIQAQIDTMGVSAVWEFFWDAAVFDINEPIILPSMTGGNVKMVKMQGQGFTGSRLAAPGCTTVRPTSAFPNNRYIFELNNPGSASVLTGQAKIDGFQAINNLDFATVNAGFVKFEAGGAVNGDENWVVSNCYTNYMWRPLHLIGAIWHGRFENLTFTSGASTFTGDADIILEDGGHVASINPSVKENVFRNIRPIHTDGSRANLIRIHSGGYNRFEGVFMGGFKVTQAQIALNNTDALKIHDNTFSDFMSIDNSTPTPDNRVASLYMTGTSVYNNVFRNMRIVPWTETVKIVGTGVKNNYIELTSYFGGTTKITDTGADPSNTFQIIAGSRDDTTQTPITHTGGVSRIIDTRRGAQNAGSQNITGDTSTTTFTFVHGLFTTPAYAIVVPGSAVIATYDFHVSWTTTHIQIIFNTAPPAGTHTLRFMTGVYK